MSAAAVPAADQAARAASPWRRRGVVLGAMLGLFAGFNGLFFATLPFFMLPIAREFGWGRSDVSLAAVLSMLGVSIASPWVGRLVDRHGAPRVVGASLVGLALGLAAMSRLGADRGVLAVLCLAIGITGAATTMAGWMTVLPRWFDRRLGVALGLAGLGLGLGVVLNGWLATTLIGRLGWREAYTVLAAITLLLGLCALWLAAPPAAAAQPPLHDTSGSAPVAAVQGSAALAAGEGLAAAVAQPRFWLLAATGFVVPLAILGSAVHAPALYGDRGLSPQQAALGASVAGLGAMAGRIVVGALLDRFFAPRVAVLVFVLGAAGLWTSSQAQTLPLLVAGSLLAGVAIGAEGDLLPYLVRRYFGLRAFGAVFGAVFAAYALGGVAGPALYGLAFDRLGSYDRVLQASALGCVVCALLLPLLGRYRFEVGSR